VPSKRRRPTEIALEILNIIEKKGEASKWDLIKILGTGEQFRHWVEDFLIEERLVEERKEGNHSYYRKTRLDEQFHGLLKNGKIMRVFLQISGRRLRRKSKNN